MGKTLNLSARGFQLLSPQVKLHKNSLSLIAHNWLTTIYLEKAVARARLVILPTGIFQVTDWSMFQLTAWLKNPRGGSFFLLDNQYCYLLCPKVLWQLSWQLDTDNFESKKKSWEWNRNTITQEILNFWGHKYLWTLWFSLWFTLDLPLAK